jgi:hypothetical protein
MPAKSQLLLTIKDIDRDTRMEGGSAHFIGARE